MENLKETRKKLQYLSDQLDQKNMYVRFLQMTEEEYIKSESSVPKPQLRSVTVSSELETLIVDQIKELETIKKNTKIKSIASWPILIGCGLAAVLNLFTSGIIGVLMLLPFALVGVWFAKDAKKGKQQIAIRETALADSREKAKKMDAENKQFNDTEYPELLKAYEQEVERLKPLYAEMRQVAKIKLAELVDKMEQEEHILAEKYYGDIKKIIEIIDDGRATSLPEAINILISDHNAQKLLNEQIRQNEIQAQAAEMQRREAEAQRREMERHNRQMEATANEQLQMQKNKIDYAKCHNCAKESYCYKKSCTGYRPK